MVLAALAAVLPACGDGKASSPSVVQAADSGAVFSAAFPDLAGKDQPLKQWQGKVMVLNFWAPWCPPCREEIPDFITLQDKYRGQGVIFVGVAIDEAQSVQSFVDETGINYPILLGGMNGVELSSKVGNRLGGLPFTAVVDRSGKIVSTHVGGLSKAQLEGALQPLL
jgi:thiol-disulfide isomerase/thioredoxin